ncbi:hypothetical protein N9W49_00515 [Alphaproteobacteria bacterium]|jgi:hypothetical protein|nr:hypothetical protein [Alphaproteobacteria bacterium]
MAGQEIRAFNVATSGFSAGVVGPARSRIQGVLVYATNITAFTIKNGSASGDTLLDLTLPAGWNDVFLPNDGILADNGAYVSALSGTGSVITLLLE